jgi:hypothetical protein
MSHFLWQGSKRLIFDAWRSPPIILNEMVDLIKLNTMF